MKIIEKKIGQYNPMLWQWILITVGCALAAGGYVIFVLPMDLVEGGVTGVGIIVKHLTGLPIVGATSLVLTAIVFVIATRLLGKGFGARSIYATILMNFLIDLFLVLKVPKITDDIMLAAFYGGAIVGVGLGVIYYAGASTGGADALGQILWKMKKIPIGRTMIIIDVIVLGAATLIFIPVEKIMYSLIFIYIEIKVIDTVISGIGANQRVMIVTDTPDVLKEAIFESLNRGLTVFKGVGAYTGVERTMLTTVVPKREIPEIRRLISHVDEKAFVIIQDIDQVYGEGFESLPPRYGSAPKAMTRGDGEKNGDAAGKA